MSATKAQIATYVMQKLGKLENGATIDANDSTLVQWKYDEAYALLASQDLVSWGSAGDVPTGYVEPMVSIVANDCMGEFIIPQDKQAVIARDAQKAMDKLSILEYQYYVPEEIEPHYF